MTCFVQWRGVSRLPDFVSMRGRESAVDSDRLGIILMDTVGVAFCPR